MDTVFHDNLISTKEAGRISGYTSDYLALLARSGRIHGKRIGHNWLLDRDSLMSFLEQHVRTKVRRAESLARLRVDEYRAAQSSAVTLPSSRASQPVFVLSSNIAVPATSFIVHAGAAVAGVLVVLAGMYGSYAEIPPAASASALAALDGTASGIRDIALTAAASAAARFESAAGIADAGRTSANELILSGTDALSIPALAYPDLAPFSMNVPANPSATIAAALAANRLSAGRAPLTLLSARTALEGISPVSAGHALAAAYLGTGTAGYEGIRFLEAAYLSSLYAAGRGALTLGAHARDAGVMLPGAAYRGAVALGREEVRGTNVAIGADVSLAYAFAEAGPAVSESVFRFTTESGGTLIFAAVSAERGAALALARAAAWPSYAAPALASAAWGTEYRAAAAFTSTVGAVSDRYLVLIEGAGGAAYAGTHGALTLLLSGSDAVAHSRVFETAAAIFGLHALPVRTY